jgi:hypothetical protein
MAPIIRRGQPQRLTLSVKFYLLEFLRRKSYRRVTPTFADIPLARVAVASDEPGRPLNEDATFATP